MSHGRINRPVFLLSPVSCHWAEVSKRGRNVVAKECGLADMRAVAAIQAQVKAMLDQTGPLQGEEVEAIHDMRVASRRLRAILGEYKALFGKPILKQAQGYVRDVTRALGKPRELDVSIALLEKHRKRLHGSQRFAANHVLSILQAQRRDESAAIARTAALVASPDFNACLEALIENAGQRRHCCLKIAIRHSTRRFDDVVKAYNQWCETSSYHQLHRLRIAFKKLRYTCEAHRELHGERMENIIRRLKHVQDALGEWHDFWIVRDFVDQAAAIAPPKAAEGTPGLRAIVVEQTEKRLADFTSHAQSFFADPERDEMIRFLGGRHRECCWFEYVRPEVAEPKPKVDQV